MSAQAAAVTGFCVTFVFAAILWAASLPLRDVSIVDIGWGWLVTSPALVFAALADTGARAPWVLAIALAWALRLSVHIALRHRGHGEDRRYQAIRARNEPNFAFKSLFLVFGLQAALACVVTLPLIGAARAASGLHALDAAGLALAIAGLVIETTADAQLERFKARGARVGGVLQSGLWRYSRHPNYFGEFCIWWGLWIVAAGAGAWWSIVSPFVMSVLLLKVSGVKLLEQDLGQRPAYREYIRRTNAFFPGRPRT